MIERFPNTVDTASMIDCSNGRIHLPIVSSSWLSVLTLRDVAREIEKFVRYLGL